MNERDEATAAALAEAMRATVEPALPPVTLLGGLRARAARRRQTRLVGAAAMTVLAVSAAAVWAAGPVERTPPTTVPSASPSPYEPEPDETDEPIPERLTVEATSLPAGYAFWHVDPRQRRLPDGTWVERRVYTRGFTDAGKPRTTIAVTTFRDAYNEVEPGRFTDRGAKARWVRLGDRRVLHVTTAAGRVEYHWTERPGLNASVTGDPEVPDAALRHVVANARVAPPVERDAVLDPLEPLGETGILHPEVRGRGSRTIGPFAVPALFEVHSVCSGSKARLRVGSASDVTLGCDGVMFLNHVDRPAGVRTITITITTDDSTRWAVLVTTDSGRSE